MAKEDLRNIPLNQVRPNDVALRSVKKEDEKFLGMVETVKKRGILNPVLVREMKDPSTNVKFWALIDGLHRYTAACEAGLDTIPCHVVTADEAEVLEMQIIANIQKVETRPVQYSEQLIRLLALNQNMTTVELANKLGKSITWVNERLHLVDLRDEIQELVDDSQINVTNATHLAKLPEEEQANFVDRAITMTPAQFIPTITARVKEIRDAKRQGRQAEGPKEFIPPVFLQKLSEIKGELNSLALGKGMINQYGITNPIDAWKLCLQWILHLDPTSIEIAKQKEEERKRELEKTKAAKKAERLAKEQAEAQAVAAGVSDDEDEE